LSEYVTKDGAAGSLKDRNTERGEACSTAGGRFAKNFQTVST